MTAYRFLIVLLVGLAAVLGATIDASNELFQDPGGNWPSGAAPVILDDCFVIKLSEQAAQKAEALPENGLPRGVEEFDALLLKRGLTTGRRVARSRGLPTLNLELFRSVGLDRIFRETRWVGGMWKDALLYRVGRKWVGPAQRFAGVQQRSTMITAGYLPITPGDEAAKDDQEDGEE